MGVRRQPDGMSAANLQRFHPGRGAPKDSVGTRTLDRQDGENIDQLAVDRLVFLDGAVDRDVGNLVIADTHHDIALPLLDGLDAGVAETAGKNAVEGTRGTATLEMTENRHADIILRILLADTVGVIHCTAILGTLGNNYDTAVLALTESTADELLQLVHIRLSSGMIAASAPEAMALFCARKPASRPITSTKKIRS